MTQDKKLKKLELEIERTNEMILFDEQYSDYKYICGIDEAGRGPLAGPVVAAAVILPDNCDILYINDSKKVSEKKRDLLYEEIQNKAISVSVGIINNILIDEINILQATYQGMKEAVDNLSVKPDLLLNDAVIIPNIDFKQIPIIKGDTKSLSIAAASIIAKVTRDNIMKKYDLLYPEYGFAKHKGYGTTVHINAIKEHGPSPIHRKTFIRKYI